MRSPFVRLPLALLFIVPVLVGQAAVFGLGRKLGQPAAAMLSALVACFVGWGAYALYVRWVEKRPLVEFGRHGALRELGAGLLLGASLFGLCVGVLALMGNYRITGTRELGMLWVPIWIALASGTIEEILFRGVIFRLLEESLGTWIALTISAALFGAIHIGNPNATLLAAVAIAFEAGVMLAAAYVLTRRLWLAMGIHAAWNFTQSGIFSVPVSGFPIQGVFIGELRGPAWLSGGAFGVEASVVAFAVCTAAGIALLLMAHRRGRFIAPFWRRGRREAEAAPTVAAAG